ncbi:unnamed protein product [Urochloa humidicola]
MAGKPKTIEELWDALTTQSKVQETKVDTMMKSISELSGRMERLEKGKSTAFDSQAREEEERRKKAAELRKQALEAAAAAAAKVMEEAGHGDSSSSIDDVISQLGKLSSDTLPKPSFAIKDSPTTTIKLSVPYYDGKEDPLPWLNKCEQFFVGHGTAENKKVWYASYHLEGAAQQWYMRLDKDHHIEDWEVFARAVNTRFGPPSRRNPLGELTALKKTGTVETYTEQFLALVARVHHLDEMQQVQIYTAGLMEPLKTDVELQAPQDMETAMSLARAYERRALVVADLTRGSTTSSRSQTRAPQASTPLASRGATSSSPPEGALATGTLNTGASSTTATPPAHPYKKLTADEMQERRRLGLCFNCDEQFSRGHICKKLFKIRW